MTNRAWYILESVAALALVVSPARASWKQPVPTETDSGVTIEISSPFEHSPPAGCLPLWVSIHNASGAARVWKFTSDGGSATGDDGNHHVVTASLRVEDGQSGHFPLLLPIAAGNSMYYYRPHHFQVEGFAVTGSQLMAPGINTHGKGNPTPVIGMSDDLATPIWANLTKQYTDNGRDLVGTPVDLTLLTPDWRGLAGLDSFWLTDTGYRSVDASRRAAIQDWVSHGGRLFVCARTDDASLRSALGLPASGDEADSGLGHVRLLRWDGSPLPLKTIDGAAGEVLQRTDPAYVDAGSWAMSKAVGDIVVNAPFLITFIVLFAAMIGPVNLFGLAPAARRHRLFWTTPLISLAASLLLVTFIIFQDGFGGSGERAIFCLLLPDEHKMVVVQEQVARTGVLFSRQFHLGEDVLLTQPRVGAGGARSFEQSGREYAGDWFTSRSIQAHRLDAVIPTRAEISLVSSNPAPTIVSTIPATLRQISYRDAANKRWTGENLRTGERVTLHPAPDEETTPPNEGSDLLQNAYRRVAGHPESFVAVADNGPFLDTLGAIHWKAQHAIFAGVLK